MEEVVLFKLIRNDVVAALGCCFTSNKIVMCWCGGINSIVIHTSMRELRTIHCADNSSTIKFISYGGELLSDEEIERISAIWNLY